MSTKEPNVQNTPETPEEIQREFPEGYVVNPEKNETVTVDGTVYRRLCIKTHVITDKDNIVDVVEKYAAPLVTRPPYPYGGHPSPPIGPLFEQICIKNSLWYRFGNSGNHGNGNSGMRYF